LTQDVERFTAQHVELAREAYTRYGKGSDAAGLNYGDCFSYVLAKATGLPLLFKGQEFLKTDLVPALSNTCPLAFQTHQMMKIRRHSWAPNGRPRGAADRESTNSESLPFTKPARSIGHASGQ
jgi:hypothetical protein